MWRQRMKVEVLSKCKSYTGGSIASISTRGDSVLVRHTFKCTHNHQRIICINSKAVAAVGRGHIGASGRGAQLLLETFAELISFPIVSCCRHMSFLARPQSTKYAFRLTNYLSAEPVLQLCA